MAFLQIKNVTIKGVSACVPSRIEKNIDFKGLSEEQLNKYIETVGVEQRHCSVHDGSICTSDLCYKSAEKLIEELKWDKSEIELLIFVSHTADYKLPSTSCILQERLGLSKNCMAFDSPLGCSGFVYGLGVAGSLLSHGSIKKALLLVGNTQSVYASPEDKSTALLFGDAGTAMALEYDPMAKDIYFHYQTDGAGKEALIVPDGGCRNPVGPSSFKMENFDEGIRRTRLHEKMDGGAVFTFALFSVPKSLKALMAHFEISDDKVDYLLLHQANKFLCDKIRSKMKFPEDKTPSNIKDFGNTSGATIPLLMVTNLRNELQEKELGLMATGFGVGLSLGSVFFSTNRIVCPDLLTLE